MSEEHTHHGNYVKVWAILVVLLCVSVVGPMFEIRVVTLLTAFGIAIVKAWMVAKNFMHVTVAPRYIAYLMGICLLFMLLLYAAAAPDIMKGEGTNWTKPGWHEVETASGASQDHH